MKPIAFVPSWYGKGLPGGAEAACYSIIHALQQRGWPVEVLTTCISSFQGNFDRNEKPQGYFVEEGIPVRRFPVLPRDREKVERANWKLMKGESVTEEEEFLFFHSLYRCPALYEYLENHQRDYHCFVFIPYLFPATIEGIRRVGDRSVLVPCFHDEPYAHTQTVAEMVSQVKGIVYLSQPEMDFVHQQYTLRPDVKESLSGLMVPGLENSHGNAARFRKKYGLESPFLLYAGRKDPGKNADLLCQYFLAFQERHEDIPLKLVLIGDKEPFTLPKEANGKILDLGFVSVQDKYDAMAACLLFCQPSVMESFSIVIMEAWAQSCPVLTHQACAVTTSFVKESQGGLYFGNYGEFEECLLYLLEHPKTAKIMGENGKNYVLSHFVEEIVTQKYLAFFQSL